MVRRNTRNSSKTMTDDLTKSDGNTDGNSDGNTDTNSKVVSSKKTNTSGISRKMKNPCLKCDKEVTSKSIGCRICGLWIHKACSNISDDLFRYMVEEQKVTGTPARWFCESCENSAKNLHKRFNDLLKRVEKLETDNQSSSNVVTKVVDRVQTLEDRPHAEKTLSGNLQRNISTCVLSEVKDRECRKSNLVIHSLPEVEPEVKEKEERIAADKVAFQTLFDQVDAGIDVESDIQFFTRLGKHTEVNSDEPTLGEEKSRPRPLIVRFKSSEKKTRVMCKARVLNETSELRHIKIVHDLTKEQRKEESEHF